MSPSFEHDYIGLSHALPAPAKATEKFVVSGKGRSLELGMKETELCLGLPGLGSLERVTVTGLSLGLTPKGCFSGAKRGFSDTIDGYGKWVVVSEGEKGEGGTFFAPVTEVNVEKEGSLATVKASVQDMKPPIPNGSVPAVDRGVAPSAKAQVVGWPPIRSYRKNTMASNPNPSKEDTAEGMQVTGCLYLKVSMDGAPYLRKIDLKNYNNYKELSFALQKMFSSFTIGQCGSRGGRDGMSESCSTYLINGSEYVLSYEDKDGDWMLVGDVPWEMFTGSCRRLRIMKGSDAIGLAPQSLEKCKNYD